jgi:hypothetical protein
MTRDSLPFRLSLAVVAGIAFLAAVMARPVSTFLAGILLAVAWLAAVFALYPWGSGDWAARLVPDPQPDARGLDAVEGVHAPRASWPATPHADDGPSGIPGEFVLHAQDADEGDKQASPGGS